MDLIDANLSNVKKVDKPWGYEIWMANNEANDYCGKILFIKKVLSHLSIFIMKKRRLFMSRAGY